MAVESTGTIEPLEESWQQKFARRLAALRAALNEAKHPLLSIAEKAALRAGGQKALPPPTDVGGLMSPDARSSGTGLGEFLIGDAPKSFERWGRGDPPYTRGEPGLAGRLPSLKPGRAQQAVDIASMMPLDLVAGAAAKPVVGMVGAVRKRGDVMPQKLAEELARYLTEYTNVKPALYEKLEKWITRSAGMDDPILQGTRPEDLLGDIKKVSAGRLRAFMPDPYETPLAERLSSARGLPLPQHGSLQDVVDTWISPFFAEGINAPQVVGPQSLDEILEYQMEEFLAGKDPPFILANTAKDLGMTPTNLVKLIQILPKDNIIAYGVPRSSYPSEIRAVLKSTQNFLDSPYAPPPNQLAKMTFPQLIEANKRATIQAFKDLQKKNRGETVMKFDDGMEWQKLSAEQLDLEGDRMSHCVGGYCQQVQEGKVEVYSLRDKKNNPKVTLSVFRYPDSPPFVEQIKGKANTMPDEYLDKIEEFVKKNELDTSNSEDWGALQEMRQSLEKYKKEMDQWKPNEGFVGSQKVTFVEDSEGLRYFLQRDHRGNVDLYYAPIGEDTAFSPYEAAFVNFLPTAVRRRLMELLEDSHIFDLELFAREQDS